MSISKAASTPNGIFFWSTALHHRCELRLPSKPWVTWVLRGGSNTLRYQWMNPPVTAYVVALRIATWLNVVSRISPIQFWGASMFWGVEAISTRMIIPLGKVGNFKTFQRFFARPVLVIIGMVSPSIRAWRLFQDIPWVPFCPRCSFSKDHRPWSRRTLPQLPTGNDLLRNEALGIVSVPFCTL